MTGPPNKAQRASVREPLKSVPSSGESQRCPRWHGSAIGRPLHPLNRAVLEHNPWRGAGHLFLHLLGGQSQRRMPAAVRGPEQVLHARTRVFYPWVSRGSCWRLLPRVCFPCLFLILMKSLPFYTITTQIGPTTHVAIYEGERIQAAWIWRPTTFTGGILEGPLSLSGLQFLHLQSEGQSTQITCRIALRVKWDNKCKVAGGCVCGKTQQMLSRNSNSSEHNNVVSGIIFLNRHFPATRKYVPFSTCNRIRTKHGKQSHCFNREHYIVNY